MPPETSPSSPPPAQQDPLRVSCLVCHVAARLERGSLFAIIHSGSSDYLRFLHDLIVRLLIDGHHVDVLDYRRAIKPVYVQQVVNRSVATPLEHLGRLNLQVILDEQHALAEAQRLNRQSPSTHGVPVLFFVDPSTLLGRLVSRVKEAATALRLQYEIAQVLAAKGYAVVVADAGGRELHRAECLVPGQLAQSSSLLLQFLPDKVLIQ
jgi:hypothetical protein